MMLKKKLISRLITISSSVLILISFAFVPSKPEEGMFPLSEIRNIDLNAAGLKISMDELYNPNDVSLVDALVRVGGCTGSFVSEEGLIITNHHCTFDAVQSVSTLENNYLENGFLAESREKEIPAKGLTCRITDSYEDVSDEVLDAANNESEVTKRIEAIANKIKEIVKREEEKDSTIEAQVSEMFVGKSYVLFRYKTINDIRIVYVPPRSIGEFGGESDNWIWPRHTGDFSFARAYVAPDGSPKPYSMDNVPYKPKKFLKVNPNGIQPEDFVFLLGYPGRTYKHQPSQFIEFQQNYQMPYIQDLYRWLIDLYEKKGEKDPEFALSISSTIKTLANTEKNYRGKMLGINRLNLIEKKQNEEKELQEYINANPELKEKYATVLQEIDDVYTETFASGRTSLVIRMAGRFVDYFRLANLFVDYTKAKEKLFPENQNPDEAKVLKMLATIDDIYNNFDEGLDKQRFKKLFFDAAQFEELKNVKPFSDLNNIKNKDEFIDELYEDSFISDGEEFREFLLDDDTKLEDVDDPFIKLAVQISDLEEIENAKQKERNGKLNILLAKFMDAKQSYMNKTFVPDANLTLRLTYGYVRGYSPSDATYYSPISTLKGVIEKGKEEGDYKLWPKIKELYNKKDFGNFTDPELNDVPVAFIYNTDTSGGNSGSPIMDSYGRLVGVNFDRAFEATINDFAWSEDYSRSIGVDIRYVLWVTSKIGGGDYLLKEMGVFE